MQLCSGEAGKSDKASIPRPGSSALREPFSTRIQALTPGHGNNAMQPLLAFSAFPVFVAKRALQPGDVSPTVFRQLANAGVPTSAVLAGALRDAFSAANCTSSYARQADENTNEGRRLACALHNLLHAGDGNETLLAWCHTQAATTSASAAEPLCIGDCLPHVADRLVNYLHSNNSLAVALLTAAYTATTENYRNHFSAASAIIAAQSQLPASDLERGGCTRLVAKELNSIFADRRIREDDEPFVRSSFEGLCRALSFHPTCQMPRTPTPTTTVMRIPSSHPSCLRWRCVAAVFGESVARRRCARGYHSKYATCPKR